MALAPIIEPFLWGKAGRRMTPEEIAKEQEIAEALGVVDMSPVDHWLQGAARMANAAVGRIREGRANRAAEENAAWREDAVSRALMGVGGAASPSAAPSTSYLGGVPLGTVDRAPLDPISDRVAQAHGDNSGFDPRIRTGIVETANALGIDPVDLATTISYETAGTFDPTKLGPKTQWGQHKGFIQFGEPQAQQHGVDWARPIESQLGANGAVASYLRNAGVKPGMGLLDVYSAVNAGAPGLYNRSDANNGGAPGTVRDKVEQQMAGHRAKAMALLGVNNQTPAASTAIMTAYAPQQMQGGALDSAPFASAGLPAAPGNNVIVAQTPEEVIAAEIATGMVADPLSLPENQVTMDYVPAQGGDYVDPVMSPRSNPNGIVDLGQGSPGEKRRGPDGQMYQYVETSGMAGASGGWGWIRVADDGGAGGLTGQVAPNDPGPWGMGMDPNNPATIPAMAGGTRDVIGAMDPVTAALFPPAPTASAGSFPQAPQAGAMGGINPAIIELLSDPRANESDRRMAGLLLQEQLAQNSAAQERAIAEQQAEIARQQRLAAAQAAGVDPRFIGDDEIWKQAAGAQFREQPTDIREYEYARSQGYPGTFAEFQLEQKRAGATNVSVNTGDTNDFFSGLSGAEGKSYQQILSTAPTAARTLAQLDQLEGLLANVETGAVAQWKQIAGNYGINTEGLSDIQAATALINQMVPSQRPPGSGPMSDADLELFKQSVPRIINQPGGNEKIIQTMRAINQYDMELARIVQDGLAVAETTSDPQQRAAIRADMRRRIAELQNPLENFNDRMGLTPGKGNRTSSGIEWRIEE